VLAGLDEDDDDQIDQPSERAAGAEAEMAKWVGSVLPLGEAKRRLLTQGLLSAGLTRERMGKAARQPGGFQVLVDMLAGKMGDLGLRPGDRLALAEAAMSDASSMTPITARPVQNGEKVETGECSTAVG